MNKMRMMRALYASLIGIGLVLAQAPQAAAGKAAPPPGSLQINDASRFTVLTAFGSAAVLDRETGVVWERTPSTTPRDWSSAQADCNGSGLGGRKGWRLPRIQELASLVDPNTPEGSLHLPPGHPFRNVQSSVYWLAPTDVDSASLAGGVHLGTGGVHSQVDKTLTNYVWCVRGGQGVDFQ